jgi:hypothetical protein
MANEEQRSSSKGFRWYIGLWAILTAIYWLACHFSKSLSPEGARLLLVVGRTPVGLLWMMSVAGALWTLGKMVGLALRVVKDSTFAQLARNFLGSLLLIVLFTLSLAIIGRMDTGVRDDQTPNKSTATH